MTWLVNADCSWSPCMIIMVCSSSALMALISFSNRSSLTCTLGNLLASLVMSSGWVANEIVYNSLDMTKLQIEEWRQEEEREWETDEWVSIQSVDGMFHTDAFIRDSDANASPSFLWRKNNNKELSIEFHYATSLIFNEFRHFCIQLHLYLWTCTLFSFSNFTLFFV